MKKITTRYSWKRDWTQLNWWGSWVNPTRKSFWSLARIIKIWTSMLGHSNQFWHLCSGLFVVDWSPPHTSHISWIEPFCYNQWLKRWRWILVGLTTTWLIMSNHHNVFGSLLWLPNCISMPVLNCKERGKSKDKVGNFYKGINIRKTDWRPEGWGKNFGRTQRDQGLAKEASDLHGILALVEQIQTRKIWGERNQYR